MSVNRIYMIEEDLPDVGCYLYVLENGKIIADHLQDDIETIIKQAKEDYGVPVDSWTGIVG